MMLAARKLVKLGASVRVVKPEADPRQLSGAAPYPRVEQVDVDLHDAERLGHALLGVHWLLLGAGEGIACRRAPLGVRIRACRPPSAKPSRRMAAIAEGCVPW